MPSWTPEDPSFTAILPRETAVLNHTLVVDKNNPHGQYHKSLHFPNRWRKKTFRHKTALLRWIYALMFCVLHWKWQIYYFISTWHRMKWCIGMLLRVSRLSKWESWFCFHIPARYAFQTVTTSLIIWSAQVGCFADWDVYILLIKGIFL